MSHRAERMAIRCPIDLFSAQEKEIIRLTRKINQAHTVTDKEPWARALIHRPTYWWAAFTMMSRRPTAACAAASPRCAAAWPIWSSEPDN